MSQKTKKIIFVITNFLLFLSVFIGVYNNIVDVGDNVVFDGVIDLANWDKNSSVYLEGEFEFYPNVFIDPKNLDDYASIKQKILVPNSWNENLGSDVGYGSYRVVLSNVDNNYYGMRIKRIRSAYTLFVNKVEVLKSGEVSDTIENSKIESYFEIVPLKAENNEIELIFHVSNYQIKDGGIIGSIEFNEIDTILNKHTKAQTTEAFIIGVIASIGLYFLLVFIQIRKESYLLNLVCIIFALSLYIGFNETQVFKLVFNYNQFTRIRMALLMLIIIAFNANLLIKKLYVNTNEKTFGITNKALLLAVLALPLLNFDSFIDYYDAFVLGMVFTISFSLISTIYLLFKNRKNNYEVIYLNLTLLNLIALAMAVIFLKVIFNFDISILINYLFVLIIGVLSTIAGWVFVYNYRLGQRYAYQNEILTTQKDIYLKNINDDIVAVVNDINNIISDVVVGKYDKASFSQNDALIKTYSKSQHLLLMLNELSNVAFKDFSYVSFNNEQINLNELINSLILMVYDTLDVDDINIVNNIKVDLPLVYGNYDTLKLAFYHIIINSINSMEKGNIVFNAKVVDDLIKIDLIDEGSGIERKDIKYIFDPFFSKNKRAGIGLPLVKNIIESLNGKINIKSKYGVGTLVSITLPINTQLEYTKNDNLGEKIALSALYVFDTLRDRESIFFKNNVDKLYVANSNEEALSIMHNYNIDIVILDDVYKSIDEDLLIEEIRNQASILDVFIIKLVGIQRKLSYLNSYNPEINEIIEKPLSASEFSHSIEKMLKIRSSLHDSIDREFQYYYSQISPHFLFNSINTIIGMSYEDVETSREALRDLSIYLRSKLEIFKNTHLIQLEDELELVFAYLNMLNLRKSDLFTLDLDIDEDIDCLIAPLSIQTIVENVFKHAFIKDEGNHLMIKVKNKGDYVEVSIIDDGVGMSREKINDIKEFKTNTLGLSTVKKRLKLYSNTDIIIESEENIGTKIILKLPINKNRG